jgi:hypothetical protein
MGTLSYGKTIPSKVDKNTHLKCLSNGLFAVKKNKVLSVADGNKTFIEKDEISYFDSLDIAEKLVHNTKGKTSVLNIIHKNDKKLQFRKEVALHNDGHLELNLKMRFFPFTDNSAPKSVSYSFFIPAKLFDGMKFKAVSGRTFSWKEVKGQFNSKMPDGYIVSQCRYLVLQGAQNSYTFDFNPQGLGSRKDWSEYGEAGGYWNVTKKGEYVKFSFGTTFKYYGGLCTGKALIYKRAYEFKERHAITHWSCGSTETKNFQFSFGTKTENKKFLAADCKVYSPERKWGWKENCNLKTLNTGMPNIINNCVFSPTGKMNEFIVDIHPGCYLISLRCGHKTQKTGSFNISLNGKISAKNIEILPGKSRTINLTKYIRTPETKLRIRFSGENTWAVKSIIIQTLIYQNEDYSIDRSFWVMDKLFSPEVK